MTETAREAVARASFDAWRDRMVSTGQKPGIAGCTVADLSESEREFADLHAAAAITAYHAWLDAHGWQIVPKEPTPEMVAAAERHIFEHMPDAQDWTLTYATDALRDGIAAAPKPPGE